MKVQGERTRAWGSLPVICPRSGKGRGRFLRQVSLGAKCEGASLLSEGVLIVSSEPLQREAPGDLFLAGEFHRQSCALGVVI